MKIVFAILFVIALATGAKGIWKGHEADRKMVQVSEILDKCTKHLERAEGLVHLYTEQKEQMLNLLDAQERGDDEDVELAKYRILAIMDSVSMYVRDTTERKRPMIEIDKDGYTDSVVVEGNSVINYAETGLKGKELHDFVKNDILTAEPVKRLYINGEWANAAVDKFPYRFFVRSEKEGRWLEEHEIKFKRGNNVVIGQDAVLFKGKKEKRRGGPED